MASSRLEIDLSAVDRNLAMVRRVLGTAPSVPPTPASGASKVGAPRPESRSGGSAAVCAVLKQDGYGIGAVRLAKKLVAGPGTGAAAGVEMIAVYTLEEARAIAEAVANVPILVLMPVTAVDRMDPVYRHLSGGRIHLTLHSEDQLRQLAEMTGRIGATLPLHVQVDTGLTRGGAMPEAAAKLVERVVSTPRAKLAGLMTHFASPCCDDEFTRQQAMLFRDFVEGIKPVLKAALTSVPDGKSGSVVPPQELMLHASNSCAMFRSRTYHGTMARVGQAILGFALEDVRTGERGRFEFASQAGRLEPAMRWTSTVVHISEVPAGWPVGYGSAWRAPWRTDGRATRIALVPVGYADGYPRSLGGRGTGGPGWVGFTGRAWERQSGGEPEGAGKTVYAPVVGRVSMDQITVDVTDVPESFLSGAGAIGSMERGPEVELMGRDRSAPNFWTTMASAAGSITHEQLCRVSARVERVYRYPASAAGVSAGEGVTGRVERSAAAKPGAASATVAEAGRDDQMGRQAAFAG